MESKYYYSKSKRFAVSIFIVHAILSAYAIYEGMGEVVMAILPAGTGFATALYANKQYQDRKREETIKNNIVEDGSTKE
jgi:hypothetical protein